MLTIARLAEQGGVGVETVRYYQRRGLMPEPPRSSEGGRSGGIRRYGPNEVRRLRFIKSAQAAGFTLQEIGELLDLDATQDRSRVRHLAQARIEALNAQIAQLQKARDALRRLARECGGTGSGPCPILAAFEHP